MGFFVSKSRDDGETSKQQRPSPALRSLSEMANGGQRGLLCPQCNSPMMVTHTRQLYDGKTFRRHQQCPACRHSTFTDNQ
jgi:ribosomal protein S27AE